MRALPPERAHEVPQSLVAMGIEGKPLAELSAKEIQRHTIRVRARAGAKRTLSPAEKSARLAAAEWQAALRRAGVRDAVAAVRHVDGHLVLEARAPLEQVERSLAKRR